MPYYPKSQIKTNLYTNGNEYLISSTNSPYTGFYYEISTGKKYTGKFLGDGPNELLVPFLETTSQDPNLFTPQNDVIGINQNYPYFPSFDFISTTDDFSNGYPDKSTIRSLPKPYYPLPTSQEIENGRFIRYFCKKTNELKYIEIDKDTFNKLQLRDPEIAWDLYQPVSIFWYLGVPGTVVPLNESAVKKIENSLKWYGFSQYLKNKYSQFSNPITPSIGNNLNK